MRVHSLVANLPHSTVNVTVQAPTRKRGSQAKLSLEKTHQNENPRKDFKLFQLKKPFNMPILEDIVPKEQDLKPTKNRRRPTENRR